MIIENNLSPILLDLGFLQVRWYGVFFALGLLGAYLLISKVFKKEGFKLAHLDSLVIYLFIGVVVGARLGHIVFYNFEYFLQNPLEILQIWKGGLSSHGATIGLAVMYWIWCRKHKVKFSKYVDAIALGIPVAAMAVRIGNYFNSEIIGVPTSGNWGVVFAKLGESFPRHPAQLYEAGVNVLALIVLWSMYRRGGLKKWPKAAFLGTYLVIYFGGRFVTEFWKERFVLPESFPLSMGQVLSLVAVAVGALILIKGMKKAK